MPIHKIKLLQRELIANNTIKLTFEKPVEIQFQSGQYGGFTLIDPAESDAKGNTRRFTILSAPHDSHLAIATRIQNSAFKRHLQTMEIGKEIKFAGPSGNFTLPNDISIPVVMIAGGIGIAPFYSMIHDELKHPSERKITLFYGNRTLADSAFIDEFYNVTEQLSNFKFIPVLENPPEEWTGAAGYITDELLAKYIPDLDKPMYYVCGSPAMVTAMQQMLQELQIPQEHIRVEDFPGY